MMLVLTLKLYSAARASWMEAALHWLFLRLTKRNCGVKAEQHQQENVSCCSTGRNLEEQNQLVLLLQDQAAIHNLLDCRTSRSRSSKLTVTSWKLEN